MRTTLVILFILGFVSPVYAQDTPKKAPVPNEAAQAEATKLIKEVYGDEYSKAQTAAKKQALAKKLLGKANESKDDPASQFVLLRLARDIATQVGDGQTSFRVIDAMADSFQVDFLGMKLAVLNKFASAAQDPSRHKAIAEEALKLVVQAVSKDNFAVADELGKLALEEARKARKKELITQAQGRITEVADLAKEYEAVKAAKLALEKTPDDPAANLVVGKYLCFAKGDWDKGLPMLALGNDDALKLVAKQELGGAASSKAQAKLGDGWWDLAERQEERAKKQIQARAGYWYQKALPGLSGLAKDKVETRVTATVPSEAHQAVATEPPARTNKSIKTSTVGGGGGSAFEDISGTQHPLVGFNVTTALWGGRNVIIKSVRPIYLTSNYTPGPRNYGKPSRKVSRIVAKQGYAVGGVVAKGMARLDGFKVIFMRIKGTSLDPADFYESDWLGGRGGGAEVRLGSNGNLVIGICGRCADDLDCLGLIQSGDEN